MSNYLMAETLTSRLTSTRLSSLCGLSGSALNTFIAAVIERAEAMINGYAGKRYHVPLIANKLLEEWTLCIAEYELYKRGPGSNVPDKIRDSYKDCLTRLTDLAEGRLVLNSAASQPNGATMTISEQQTFFDADSMGGY